MSKQRQHIFAKFAEAASYGAGAPYAFVAAVGLIVIWAVTGPFFGFSDTWQIVINTATTIITFLLVFLIQHSQNRDTRALHIKIDELIRATEGARNQLIDLEKMDEDELEKVREQYTALAKKAHALLEEDEEREEENKNAPPAHGRKG